MADWFKQIKLKNVIIVFISTLFGIQIISLLLSQLFEEIPLLKGGPAILLLLLSISVITLFVIGIKVDELSRKENLIFIIIVFGLVALAFWKLEEFFPQIFSISPEFSNSIKSTLSSIIGG